MDIATTIDRLTADPRLMAAALETAQKLGIGEPVLRQVLPRIGELARAGATEPARIAQAVQAATGADALAVLNLLQAMTGAAQGLAPAAGIGVEAREGGSMAQSRNDPTSAEPLGPVDGLLNRG